MFGMCRHQTRVIVCLCTELTTYLECCDAVCEAEPAWVGTGSVGLSALSTNWHHVASRTVRDDNRDGLVTFVNWYHYSSSSSLISCLPGEDRPVPWPSLWLPRVPLFGHVEACLYVCVFISFVLCRCSHMCWCSDGFRFRLNVEDWLLVCES